MSDHHPLGPRATFPHPDRKTDETGAFCSEGILTFVVGVASWWMVYDWPDSARFLSPEDQIRIQRRLLAAKQGTVAENSGREYMYEALKDWKTYGYMFIYMGCLMPLYAFSLFLPT